MIRARAPDARDCVEVQRLDPDGTGNSPDIHVRIPRDASARLDRLAAERGVTRSSVAREILTRALATEMSTTAH